MNNPTTKFFIVFFGLMFITLGLTFGMIWIIGNVNDPNAALYGIGFFLITFLPLLFGSMWYLQRNMSGNDKHSKKLLATGSRAPATVMEVQDTGVTMNDIYPMVRLGLRVNPKLGSSFDVNIETFVSRINIPHPGDVLQVVYDPANPRDIMLANQQNQT